MAVSGARDATGSSLRAIVVALEDLTDVELSALMTATEDMQAAPGLRAWLETACTWEMNRRAGRLHPLVLPDVPIPMHEDVLNIGATLLMQSLFAQDTRTHEVFVLFDAIVDLLAETGHQQQDSGPGQLEPDPRIQGAA